MKYLEYEVKNNTLVRVAGDKTTLISGAVNYFGMHFTFDEEFTNVGGDKSVEFFKERVREKVQLDGGGLCAIPNSFLENEAAIEFRVVAGSTLATPWVSLGITKSGAILPEGPAEPAPVGTEYVTSEQGDKQIAKLRLGDDGGLEYSHNGSDFKAAAGEKAEATDITLADSMVESNAGALLAKLNEVINALQAHGIVKAAQPTGAKRITVIPQAEQVGYGTKTAADLFQDDVEIAWEGTKGTVTGTFKKVTDWNELPREPHEGHFFAIRFDSQYLGKPISFIKGSGKPATTQKATADDMFWVMCLEEAKKFTAKSGDDVIMELDLEGATLLES